MANQVVLAQIKQIGCDVPAGQDKHWYPNWNQYEPDLREWRKARSRRSKAHDGPARTNAFWRRRQSMSCKRAPTFVDLGFLLVQESRTTS
jgi:hypothetical protein